MVAVLLLKSVPEVPQTNEQGRWHHLRQPTVPNIPLLKLKVEVTQDTMHMQPGVLASAVPFATAPLAMFGALGGPISPVYVGTCTGFISTLE